MSCLYTYLSDTILQHVSLQPHLTLCHVLLTSESDCTQYHVHAAFTGFFSARVTMAQSHLVQTMTTTFRSSH